MALPDVPDTAIGRDAIPLHRLPWARPLLSAAATDFASVAPVFAGDPSTAASWRDAIARVLAAPRDRDAIAGILDRQIAARGGPDEAAAQATRLRDPQSVTIVTGQQAGVFGGPLYTLLKAITTVQLARHVERAHGIPVVPIFWADAEDHDWQEVHTCRVLDRDMHVRDIDVPDPEGAGARPVGQLRLDARIDDVINAVAGVLAPTEFTADLMTSLRGCYRPGAGMTAAYAAWIEQLLGRHGLVVFESGDPAAKPLVAEVFGRELDQPGRTSALALEGAALLRRLGHAPQVEPAEDGVAVFYVNDRGRRAIRWRDAQYTIDDRRCDRAALSEEAREHPERFSPNVLLRPIVQDRLFPSVAYVPGPGEIAYHAQLGGIYRAFDVPRPLLYLRATATILDAPASRFLMKSQLPFEDLKAQDDSVLNRLLERQLPPEIEAAISAADREISARMNEVKSAVGVVDPTLGGAADTTADRVRETLNTLRGKIIQASKRKEDTLRRQFVRTRTLAFPGGEPQERALNLVFFLNKYGPTFPDRLLDILPLDLAHHSVVTL